MMYTPPMRPAVSMLAAALLLHSASAGGAAQSDDLCAPGETPHYVSGFADLKARIGDRMGDPVTCEFPDPNGSGDIHQRTTTGLAFWRKSTNTPMFTNGWEHWANTPAGLVTWTGASIDLPAAGPVQPAEWQTYANGRYQFTVRIPPDWVIGEDSAIGDGASLYVGNPDVQISAYGSLNTEGTLDALTDTGFRIQPVTLDDGNSALFSVGHPGGRVIAQVVLVKPVTYFNQQNVPVAFSVYADVTESFFTQNEGTLLRVMRSLHPTS